MNHDAQRWGKKLMREYPEAGNTPSQINAIPRVTPEELLAQVTSALALAAENYLALARGRLADDALATVMLDARADEIRDLFQVAGLAGIRIWTELAPTSGKGDE